MAGMAPCSLAPYEIQGGWPVVWRAAAQHNWRDTNQTATHVELLGEGLWTRVQFPPAPPIPKIPTLIGWDFFCPFPQCWRGFAGRPLDHASPEVGVPGAFFALFLSLFSAALLSIQGPKSWIGAGLRAIGLLLRLVGSTRPRQQKAQNNARI